MASMVMLILAPTLVTFAERPYPIGIGTISARTSASLCATVSDAVGNLAVILAAIGVFGTGAGWPDIVVAGVMGVLGLSAARTVIAQARGELRGA